MAVFDRSPSPLDVQSATACASVIELHLAFDPFLVLQQFFQLISASWRSTISPMSASARSGDSTPPALRSALLSSFSEVGVSLISVNHWLTGHFLMAPRESIERLEKFLFAHAKRACASIHRADAGFVQ